MSTNEQEQLWGALFGYLSLGAGTVAAIGSALLLFGLSPGFVAQHPGEAGWDLFWNHLCYLGPVVVLGWFFLAIADAKNRYFFCLLITSLGWLAGFAFIR